ncbi:MAG: hypothetical protein COU27_03160 [Candidatus Levybacteria bacterium CG10_big_fil_rev_8_21_14_0_10_36_7]|nr:MAG: hypothetical protein COU27_03160 [Candidatus Levybacteria bacterium CG10_big_fil_rev_8_21_14_0_10_36_7]
MSKKELFWTLEILFLTPLAIFWLGVMTKLLTGSNLITNMVVGQPYQLIRMFIVTIILPILAVWYATDFLKTNKKGKSALYARIIVVVGITSLGVSLFSLFVK